MPPRKKASRNPPPDTPSTPTPPRIRIIRPPQSNTPPALATAMHPPTTPTPPTPPQTLAQALSKQTDWDRDGLGGSATSLVLLLEWTEIPANWDYFELGKDGGNQKKGSERCSASLKEHTCHTE